MNKKEFYEAPEWGLRVLMLERTPICTSPDGSWDNSIRGGSTWANDPDDGYGLDED